MKQRHSCIYATAWEIARNSLNTTMQKKSTAANLLAAREGTGAVYFSDSGDQKVNRST